MLPEKKRDFLIVAITQVIAYIFLFLIAPNTISGGEVFIMTVVFACVGIIYTISFIKYPVKFSRWLWGIPIMWGLIMLYSGDLYGITNHVGIGPVPDMTPGSLDAAIFAIKLFLIQCAIKAVLFIGKFVKKKVFPM